MKFHTLGYSEKMYTFAQHVRCPPQVKLGGSLGYPSQTNTVKCLRTAYQSSCLVYFPIDHSKIVQPILKGTFQVQERKKASLSQLYYSSIMIHFDLIKLKATLRFIHYCLSENVKEKNIFYPCFSIHLSFLSANSFPEIFFNFGFFRAISHFSVASK